MIAAGVVVSIVLIGDNDNKGASDQSLTPADVRALRKEARRGAPRLQHPPGRPNGPLGAKLPTSFPGALGRGRLAYFSGEAIRPGTSHWIISNHRKTTAVEAGGDATDRNNGIFGIFRSDSILVKQKLELVKVLGTGPVRIVEAPLGRGAVQTWAQKRGELRFTSESGITGTLHLRDDSITLDSG